MIKRIIDYKYSLFFFLVMMGSVQLQAQEVKVRSGFFKDSVGIGEVTKYYLTATYPSKLNILFPDSTFTYKPFEFEGKKYFATQTTNNLSYDSVIYELSTFEIEKIQILNLPVYAISRNDSVAFTGNPDSIRLIELVASVPDSIPADKLPLKMNTAYYKVPFLFNYPILVIVLVALLIIALLVYFIFGKQIRKHYRIKRLEKEHSKFMEAYTLQLNQVKQAPSSASTESTVTIWKKYMERLEERPYTKLTTREMLLLDQNELLGNALHAIDKAVYGQSASVAESLALLQSYAGDKFLKKLDQVKHGK